MAVQARGAFAVCPDQEEQHASDFASESSAQSAAVSRWLEQLLASLQTEVRGARRAPEQRLALWAVPLQ